MTTTNASNVINLREATKTSEAKNLNIMEQNPPGFQDCTRKVRLARAQRKRERRANRIAELIVGFSIFFSSSITFYFSMMFIYKVFHPATLERFLFDGIIIGFIVVSIWGIAFGYVKERIYQKR